MAAFITNLRWIYETCARLASVQMKNCQRFSFRICLAMTFCLFSHYSFRPSKFVFFVASPLPQTLTHSLSFMSLAKHGIVLAMSGGPDDKMPNKFICSRFCFNFVHSSSTHLAPSSWDVRLTVFMWDGRAFWRRTSNVQQRNNKNEDK